jgi:peptide/nickel transport system substrate-binding protein
MFGLSLGSIGMLLRYVGEADVAHAAPVLGKAGGTLRAGSPLREPARAVPPERRGALAFAGIPGEYLTFTNPQAQVQPMLATSWKPNKDATVWTFQLRKACASTTARR